LRQNLKLVLIFASAHDRCAKKKSSELNFCECVFVRKAESLVEEMPSELSEDFVSYAIRSTQKARRLHKRVEVQGPRWKRSAAIFSFSSPFLSLFIPGVSPGI
jgi:hypothetical protein